MLLFFRVFSLVALAVGLHVSSAHAVLTKRVAASSKNSTVAVKRKVTKVPVVSRRKVAIRSAAAPSKRRAIVNVVLTRSKPSFGQLAGLHSGNDALDLKSSVALVVDQDTQEVLFSKNEQAILPIASITKLMTGVIVRDARLPMDEMITISQDDVDTEKGSRSRLKVGTELSRGELMHLALMSSENRAAHALGRSYPGGLTAFVTAMNIKARLLGMSDTRYVEPTGLSSSNQSSARDLVTLVNLAHADPVLRELSTSTGFEVDVGNRILQFNNTNRLVKNPTWDIGLQKTGYITEAGQCLVMQAKVAGRKLIMVFLDSAGKLSRLGDAERVRHWVETTPALTAPRSVPAAVVLSEKALFKS